MLLHVCRAAALNVLPRLQAPRPQASPPRHQASSRRHQASPPRREASPQRAKSAPQSPTSDDFTYTDSEPEEQAEEPAANGDHAQDPQNLPSGWIRGRHQGMPYMSSELPGTDAVWKKAVEANNENRRTWSDQPGSQEGEYNIEHSAWQLTLTQGEASPACLCSRSCSSLFLSCVSAMISRAETTLSLPDLTNAKASQGCYQYKPYPGLQGRSGSQRSSV